MGRIKFGIDGANEELEGDGFNNKVPVNGTYEGIVKRMELTKTTGGPKAKTPAGTPMVRVLVEITGPPSAKEYHGVGLFRNFVLTQASAAFTNQFLDALTNGSEVEVKRIRKAFWDDGPFVNEEGHFIKIGNVQIGSPEGKRKVLFMTKTKTYEGEKKAEISRFLVRTSDEADDYTDEVADADLGDEDDFDSSVPLDDDSDEDMSDVHEVEIDDDGKEAPF